MVVFFVGFGDLFFIFVFFGFWSVYGIGIVVFVWKGSFGRLGFFDFGCFSSSEWRSYSCRDFVVEVGVFCIVLFIFFLMVFED